MIRTLLLAAATSACGVETLDSSPETTEGLLEVGVIPYSRTGREPCADPRSRWATLTIEGGGEHGCVLETGALGESYWAAPTASKYPITTELCATGSSFTEITFCRTTVDEHTFRPLTRDPSEREQFYALLRFGERCPPQSIGVNKYIYTEELRERFNRNSFDNAFPNVSDPSYSGVELYFCLFTQAEEDGETMSEFPDLGFPYAVFHDFDGPQPDWVMLKRWLLTDDTDAGPRGYYHPPITERTAPILDSVEAAIVKEGEPPRAEDKTELQNPETVFDVARVR